MSSRKRSNRSRWRAPDRQPVSRKTSVFLHSIAFEHTRRSRQLYVKTLPLVWCRANAFPAAAHSHGTPDTACPAGNEKPPGGGRPGGDECAFLTPKCAEGSCRSFYPNRT